MNDFDKVAKHYDWLKRIVFGNEMTKASGYFLRQIPNGSSVLLTGGGSGQDLEDLPDVNVDYVEKSAKMLKLAQGRSSLARVNFINDDFMEWETDRKYDFIFCPFFLDIFDKESLVAAIVKLKSLIAPEGHLIVTDFQPPSSMWQKAILWIMYRFFRAFASLQSKKLLPILHELVDQDFSAVEKAEFNSGFVFTCKMRLNGQARPDRGGTAEIRKPEYRFSKATKCLICPLKIFLEYLEKTDFLGHELSKIIGHVPKEAWIRKKGKVTYDPSDSVYHLTSFRNFLMNFEYNRNYLIYQYKPIPYHWSGANQEKYRPNLTAYIKLQR